eukprot:TRINITY_DN5722_c0_g1_i1.p1 TRINITY_DN5722_c0_g1~~TRINITY_DN5722_c0_g1_i1.p1  ORF type:complete len:413 (-),score=61.27 TRINITY_DN5722_c0_g1_i1:23-1261(-)
MRLLLFLVTFSFFACSIYGLNNGLGKTPPMGWSSWNLFNSHISDELIRGIAEGMVRSGLASVGYEYINIDDGWAIGRFPNGTIQVDSKLFPFGMKSLADYVHSRGLKLGIYTSRGERTCLGRPGSLGYEEIDAKTYASWGIDYLKADSCGTEPTNETEQHQYEIMRDALNATGRLIYYSICETLPKTKTPITPYGVVYTPEAVGGSVVRDIANSWLVEYVNMADTWYSEINGGYYGLLSNLDSQQNLTDPSYAGPGGWNDMDMMECCNGGMTNVEYTSHFSLWSILTSPLILSNDLRVVTQACLDIIANKEVIAVNQDPLGIQGRLVYADSTNTLQIFTKPLQDGSIAALLFNRGSTQTSTRLDWSTIKLPSQQKASVRDLWQHKDMGDFTSSYAVTIERHGVVMLKIKALN